MSSGVFRRQDQVAALFGILCRGFEIGREFPDDISPAGAKPKSKRRMCCITARIFSNEVTGAFLYCILKLERGGQSFAAIQFSMSATEVKSLFFCTESALKWDCPCLQCGRPRCGDVILYGGTKENVVMQKV